MRGDEPLFFGLIGFGFCLDIYFFFFFDTFDTKREK